MRGWEIMSYLENNEYRKAKATLKDEYAMEYDKCEAYIHSMRTEGKIEENCLIQILDDFLSAQADDKPIHIITGPDLRNFCDNILNAERDCNRNKAVYYIQWISVIPLVISLAIFIRCFLNTKPGHFLDNIDNIYVEGYELYYLLIFLFGLLLKKQISVLFFQHSRMLRTVETAVYIFIIGITSIIAISLSTIFPISIPITYPVYIIMSILTTTVFLACWIYSKKTKPVRSNTNIECDE
jgi:DNA-binding ferritin-like protein (Dps family)